MAQRQVTTICPKTGRTIWVYEDLGASAAKVNHGSPGSVRGAVGPGHFAGRKKTISSTRGAKGDA